MENWIDVKNYEGLYQVSNLGNVRSLERTKLINDVAIKVPEKILKARNTGKGYLIVTLYKNSKATNFKIHRLVIEHFLHQSKLHVDHIDMNRSNNNITNLRYCTPRQNKVYSLGDRKNMSSKYTGVNARGKRWIAQCTINGKSKYLGMYNCEFVAHLAYLNATK
jgi:hypothetical protein